MEDNEILYHYTSIEGLNGILKNRSIWASDYHFLNDINEFDLAVKTFLEEYQGIDYKALELALHSFQFHNHHCIFSLSKSPKTLSQWRAYSNNGKGACIGFRYKLLNSVDKYITQETVTCIYSNQKKFIRSLSSKFHREINEVIEIYKKEPAFNSFLDNIENRPSLLNSLINQLLRIKNKAFKEEKETRIVMTVPREKMQSRVSNDLIVPYFDFKFLNDLNLSAMSAIVPEIWFGPKSDKRNKKALMIYSDYLLGMNGNFKTYDCGYV